MTPIKSKKLLSYINPFEDILPGFNSIFNQEAIKNFLLRGDIYHQENDDQFDNNYRNCGDREWDCDECTAQEKCEYVSNKYLELEEKKGKLSLRKPRTPKEEIYAFNAKKRLDRNLQK